MFHQFWNSFGLLLIDSVILLAGLLLGDLLLFYLQGIHISIQYSVLVIPAWYVGALITGQVPGWGLGAIEEFRRIELLLLVIFAAAGFSAFMLRGMPSRISLLTAYATSAALLPFGRILCRQLLRRLKIWGCPAVIYGDQEIIARILNVLHEEATIGYNPCGVFTDDVVEGGINGVPVLGTLNGATNKASVAIASIAHLRNHDLVGFIDHTLAGYHKVVLLPDISEGVFSWVVPRDFNGMIGLEVSRNLLVPFAAFIKRLYETGLVLLFLPLWLPLIIVLALLVFVSDRRNPFYAQERVGRKGRLFKAIKLRTMVPDADQALQNVLAADEAKRNEWETFYKLKTDPRITRIGRLLRRFSLDELPQFLNVLSGEMALVGPRPLPVYHQDGLSEKSRLIRSKVRPGMTGQWQVSGRSDCNVEEMEQWDNFYVRNWSVWMDIYIMARTLRVVLFSQGAY
ncbi:UDP-glucose:undecaprenyl-phosphate glucose-1-phosphate transferase [Pontiella sulfatireligans]|uniref:UDP-glucose:undecaprenyl-phosphate glucose-1-phosphate transferase n=2 Tax=Pontiella sulfatireligans TaxID=2750658 RepID=A0A6C2UGF1_9BACT|nr:UDP-glucose:undecaprenyl-phosphate glucose-1-phosphate transferase [Pontiella sulfatireligans]